MDAGLAVSRALGDKYLKGEGVPLLGKPDVCAPIPAASGAATLAILASDGLWDVTTPSRVCICFVGKLLALVVELQGPH